MRTNDLPPSAPGRPLANTYWVIPGRILAGEYPGDADDVGARARLASLLAAGIDSFVDLTEESELPPYRHFLPPHIDYLRSPIVDAGVPNNVAQIRELLSTIEDALDQNRRLYVHCRAGIGRTGLVMGCFLADAKADGKKALKILNQLWRQSERATLWPTIPQTAAQAHYVKRWPVLSNRTF